MRKESIHSSILIRNTAINALPEEALYARVDIVSLNGVLMIIEVELIEPSLYFNMDNASADFFAKLFAEKFAC